MKKILLPASLDSIPELQDMVRSAVHEQAPDADTGMLEMALEELLVNVASYAYPDGRGDVELSCETDGGDLRMTLRDTGTPYDPTTVPEPDLSLDVEDRPIGGLGVFLAKKVFASMRYRRDGNANILTLCYALPARTAGRAVDGTV